MNRTELSESTAKQRPSGFPVAAFTVCLMAATLMLPGCATDQKPAPDAWLQDKAMVMRAVAQNLSHQKQLEEQIDALRKQLAEQKTESQQQQADLASTQKTIAQMQAKIGRLQSAAARMNKSRKITKQKLDKKIEKIAQAIKPAEPAEQAVNSEEEKDHYTAAYLALKSGRYDEAIEKFRELLKTYPNGGYSDQAYYWLGESYLAQNNIERAVGNLEWMVGHYPESTKHAAGMLRLGMTYQLQQRLDESRDILLRLIEKHADSPAAEEARKLLQSKPEAASK